MKKLFKTIGVILLIMILSGVLVGVFLDDGKDSSGNAVIKENNVTYGIEYYAVKNNGIVRVDSSWQKENGQYPDSYDVTKGTMVSGLERIVGTGAERRKFEGWYLDEDLTVPFDGEIKAGSGGVVLYADIREVAEFYTIHYYGVINGNVSTISKAMYPNNAIGVRGNCPEEYVVGDETLVSDLVSISSGNTEYTFEGWYLDEDLTVPFERKISSETRGDINLYAKISVAYYTDFYE